MTPATDGACIPQTHCAKAQSLTYEESLDGNRGGLCACRLIAGGVAGMVSRASVAPFERMRTMYMVRQADGRSLGMGGEPLSIPPSAAYAIHS